MTTLKGYIPVADHTQGDLVLVAVHYKNAKGSGFSFHMMDPGWKMAALREKLERALVDYNEPSKMPGWTVSEAFTQLDEITELCNPHKGTNIPPGTLDPQQILVAAMNVNWLEANGHLRVDEHNGMQFMWEPRRAKATTGDGGINA